MAAIALGASMAVPMVGAAVPSVAAAAACSVGGDVDPTNDLQAAIDGAASGSTLTIGGTCTGNFKISKSLTIQKRANADEAVLQGDGGRTLRIFDGTVKLVGVEITGGTAPNCPAWNLYVCGGGLYVDAPAVVTLDQVSVHHNSAIGTDTQGPSTYGGGIYSGGSLTITRSTINDNESTASNGRGDAAGIASDGLLVIRSSLITGNRGFSASDPSWGAGVYEYQGKLLVSDTTIYGNVARGSRAGNGGGVYIHDGSAAFRRSLISGNRAEATTGTDTSGGAIWTNGPVVIENSTIARNVADTAGAIMAEGDVTLTASTVARNQATLAGGALVQAAGRLTLRASIVALNLAGGSGKDCLVQSGATTTDRGWNLLGTGQGCVGFVNGRRGDKVGTDARRINPRLDVISMNGGQTPTMALLPGSPAINAAGSAPCAVPVDQRGVRRPQGGRCDIGAYEKR
ncbi:MAG: choice-of-anchor Q domain-containing protein [Chloroflexota bacterium]